MNFPQAIGVSLGVILLSSTLNTFHYLRSGFKPKSEIWAPMVPGIIIGLIAGAFLIQIISKFQASLTFSGLLLVSIIKTMNSTSQGAEDASGTPKANLLKFSIGLFSGALSAITGVGGGVIFIPALISIFRVSVKEVAAYSNILMVAVSSFGVLNSSLLYGSKAQSTSIFQVGNVNFGLVLILFTGASITSKIGIKVNDRTSKERKKNLLLLLLLFTLGKMLYSSYKLS